MKSFKCNNYLIKTQKLSDIRISCSSPFWLFCSIVYVHGLEEISQFWQLRISWSFGNFVKILFFTIKDTVIIWISGSNLEILNIKVVEIILTLTEILIYRHPSRERPYIKVQAGPSSVPLFYWKMASLNEFRQEFKLVTVSLKRFQIFFLENLILSMILRRNFVWDNLRKIAEMAKSTSSHNWLLIDDLIN